MEAEDNDPHPVAADVRSSANGRTVLQNVRQTEHMSDEMQISEAGEYVKLLLEGAESQTTTQSLKRKRDAILPQKEAEKAQRAEDLAHLRQRYNVPGRHELYTAPMTQFEGTTLFDEHHIFTTPKGYKFELTVQTQASWKGESGKLCVQLFESNDIPHSYAVNTSFAPSVDWPGKNTISAIHVNQLTALRRWYNDIFSLTGQNLEKVELV